VYYVPERDEEQLVAVRLTGRELEIVRRMIAENEVEMESRVLGVGTLTGVDPAAWRVSVRATSRGCTHYTVSGAGLVN
jgi:hypothetical protein